MGKKLDKKMIMYATVDDYLGKFIELLERFLRLKKERYSFKDMLTELVLQVANKTQVTTGITVGKADSFALVGNLIVNASLKALVWAKDTKNQPLVAVFTVVPSRYANKTYAKKLEQAKAVYAALSANAAALAGYNISDAELAAIAAAIQTCQTANLAPGKASKDKQNAKSTAEIIEAKMDASLVTMDNLIIGEYSVTEASFVSGYLLSRKVDSVGVRHTGISATITDAATGKAIENATLTVGGTNKTAASNMAGLAEISKMKAGSYHISIAAEGYTTQLQDVTVGKGKVVALTVALVVA